MSVAAFETEADPSKVHLANWRNSPFSRWVFRNIRDVLPVADIASSVDAVAPLPHRSTALAQFRLGGEGGVALGLDDVRARPLPMDS